MTVTNCIIAGIFLFIILQSANCLRIEINTLNRRIDAMNERMDLLRDNIMQRQENDMKSIRDQKIIR
jgi:hypothetical protein